jgi:hypothetical protein
MLLVERFTFCHDPTRELDAGSGGIGAANATPKDKRIDAKVKRILVIVTSVFVSEISLFALMFFNFYFGNIDLKNMSWRGFKLISLIFSLK